MFVMVNKKAGCDVPLISFGGSTTPWGALISSRPPMATSPFVADGAMIGIWLRGTKGEVVAVNAQSLQNIESS